jgi:hypothetical protein
VAASPAWTKEAEAKAINPIEAIMFRKRFVFVFIWLLVLNPAYQRREGMRFWE